MANHQAQCLHRPLKHLGGALGAVGMAQAVETEAAYAPLARPAIRHGIGAGLGRQRGMKGSIEDGHLRHAGQLRFRGGKRLQARRVVQRR